MKTRTSVLALVGVAAVLALAVVAAGCGGDDHDSGGTAKGNATDAAFINDMTSHHQGAIEMAEMATEHAEHAQIRTLAGDIVSAQESEIADMKRMRDSMRSMHSDETHDGHMGMSASEMGMDMDMSKLGRAKPFDKAFIDAMIPHHKGAIAMAKQLLAKGENPELRKMAQGIIDAQSREIAQMQKWRKQWYGAMQMDMGG